METSKYVTSVFMEQSLLPRSSRPQKVVSSCLLPSFLPLNHILSGLRIFTMDNSTVETLKGPVEVPMTTYGVCIRQEHTDGTVSGGG